MEFEKFMKKMDKEVSLLSKITEGVSKCGKIKRDQNNRIEESVDNLKKEISTLKEQNAKLNSKIESLTQTQNQDQKTENTTNYAANDLKTILSIVNLIGNNPGVVTIILQELMGKLKLETSKQIYDKIYDINLKLSSKPDIASPYKRKTSLSNKKRSSTEHKKTKFEGNLQNSRSLNEFQVTSQEIDKQLSEYTENGKEKLVIQKLNEEGYYKIGNKKVVLQMVNGRLVVRIGGGFLQLKDFLEFYNIQEIKRSNQISDRLFNEKSI